MSNDRYLLHKPETWHIGSMDVTENDRTSYEGDLLSVSECPGDWQRIAKLAGDLWRVSNPNAFFFDAHAFMAEKENQSVLQFWGDAKGLVEFKTTFEVTVDDGEMGEMVFQFESLEEVYEEFDPDETDVEVKEKIFTPVMTDKALEKYGLRRNGIQFDMDYVLMDFVEKKLAKQDARVKGVWWNDRHDPDRLSAPRGGIFPSAVELFQVTREPRAANDIGLDGDDEIDLPAP